MGFKIQRDWNHLPKALKTNNKPMVLAHIPKALKTYNKPMVLATSTVFLDDFGWKTSSFRGFWWGTGWGLSTNRGSLSDPEPRGARGRARAAEWQKWFTWGLLRISSCFCFLGVFFCLTIFGLLGMNEFCILSLNSDLVASWWCLLWLEESFEM